MLNLRVMRIYGHIVFAAALLIGTASCDNTPQPTDTLSAGSIDIAVDETYKPIVDEAKKVFDSSYPEANVTIHYKSEAECIKDFMDNKVRLILVTRQLTDAEKKTEEDKKQWSASLPLAKDAVAIIVNKDATDTMLDLSALKGILTDVYEKKYTVVFDNQGSSTVRYITDSLIPGQKLGNNVFAAKSNTAVVDYVAQNPNAIGVVGLMYASDTADVNNTGAFNGKVKVVAMKDPKTGQFNKPYQAYIALKSYPLTRTFYYIHHDSYPGLAKGFANFLASERGQLIFAHAQLFPLQMNIVIRDAKINNE